MWVDKVLGLFAPAICKGCGVSGTGLCDSCRLEITEEPYARCVVCSNLATTNNLCSVDAASSPFARAFVVGKNSGTLKTLVYDYKLKPERALARTLVQVLDDVLPILPSGVVVVPIPTIRTHVRQRGFGHTELVAKLFAKRRKLKYRNLLARTDNIVMHGLKKNERVKAAAQTFSCKGNPSYEEILLIDDIYTTGSTVTAAAKLLKESGVQKINLVIIARQEKK